MSERCACGHLNETCTRELGWLPPSAPPSLDAAALREVGTRDPWVIAGDHPESRCGRCGHANVWSWSAPSPLWNAVMRDPKTGADAYDLVCPPCFSELASLGGLGGKPLDGLPRWSWKFAPDISDEEIAALWVDRDGRVWDPETWLWKDAALEEPVDTGPFGQRFIARLQEPER